MKFYTEDFIGKRNPKLILNEKLHFLCSAADKETQIKVISMLYVNLNFKPIFRFYTPWKRQKTSVFLIFSGGIEIEYWFEMG